MKCDCGSINFQIVIREYPEFSIGTCCNCKKRYAIKQTVLQANRDWIREKTLKESKNYIFERYLVDQMIKSTQKQHSPLLYSV